MNGTSIFISYSHKDESWKEKLVKHLGVLDHAYELEVWDDRRITTGQDWYAEIEKAMNRASIAILMVSADFLTSDFIKKEEIPRLLQRRKGGGVVLYPIIVHACAWSTVPWLQPIQLRNGKQALSLGSNPEIDQDLALITEEIASFLAKDKPLHQVIRPEFSSSGVLTDSQLDELNELAGRITISEKKLVELYRKSIPTGIPAVEGVGSMRLLIKHLCNMPHQPASTYPILVFAERLARYIAESNPAMAQPLLDWISQVAGSMGVDDDELLRMRQKLSDEDFQGSDVPYLLVDIQPDPSTKNASTGKLYRLYVVFWRSPEDYKYIRKDDALLPLDQIRQLLDESLGDLAREIPGEINDLAFEFFLPIELLSFDVDQWTKEDDFLDDFQIKLGEEHQVLVRSHERATNPRLQIHWYPKWKHFASSKKGMMAQDCVRLCNVDAYKKKELYNKLTNNHAINCMGLSFIPSARENGILLLREMLYSGLPIALWPRLIPDDDATEDKIVAEIEDILKTTSLVRLPELVLEKRKDASLKEPSALGNHLTLLWDDPNRLPDDLFGHRKRRITSP